MENLNQQNTELLLEKTVCPTSQFTQNFKVHKLLEEDRPGVLHTLLQLEPKSIRDINRTPAKLKMLCGAYTLKINKNFV